MREFDRTIISQYSNSATLTQLITNLNTYIDPNANLQRFYDLIWNVDTAVGYGLDVWGRIVGIARFLKIPTGKFFGFAEATTASADPFNISGAVITPYFGFTETADLFAFGFDQDHFADFPAPLNDVSPFYSDGVLTTTFTLDDEQYRTLIFAKAAANICDGSIPAINQIMMNLFPRRGNAYVTDARNTPHNRWFGFAEARDADSFNIPGVPRTPYFGFGEDSEAEGFEQYQFDDFHLPLNEVSSFGDLEVGSLPDAMTLVYVFEFVLQPFEIAIVVDSGVLPKPTGVLARARYM